MLRKISTRVPCDADASDGEQEGEREPLQRSYVYDKMEGRGVPFDWILFPERGMSVRGRKASTRRKRGRKTVDFSRDHIFAEDLLSSPFAASCC